MTGLCLKPFKPAVHLNNVQNPVYTSQKKGCQHYEVQPVDATREIMAVYCENRTKHINTPFGQNVEIASN